MRVTHSKHRNTVELLVVVVLCRISCLGVWAKDTDIRPVDCTEATLKAPQRRELRVELDDLRISSWHRDIVVPHARDFLDQHVSVAKSVAKLL